MEVNTLLVLGVVIIGYATVARRIDTAPISGPMVFVGAGLLLGSEVLGWLESDLSSATITGLVEATLAVVLFSDASRIELPNLRTHWTLPGRLLVIGLPLAMVFGALASMLLFGELGWEGAILIGVMLAPTDAALGQAVVTDRSVPVYVRQGLNVESGLNDGLAFPVFEAAVALALVGHLETGASGALVDLLEEVVLGTIAGAVVGLACGPLLSWSRRSGWTGRHWHGIATLGMVAAAYGLADGIGGNPFIAAFAAGLAYRPSVDLPMADDVSHDVSELLTMLAFVVFGGVVLGPNLDVFGWRTLLYGVLSLTVVRIVAVGIALLAKRVRLPTVVFIGWFGPRGIASVLYSFLLLESADGMPVAREVVDVVTVTVTLSVVLHGMTASSLAKAYGRWFSSMEEDHEEMVESTDVHEHDLGRCSDAAGAASSSATSPPPPPSP